jgi:hypothetical protein
VPDPGLVIDDRRAQAPSVATEVEEKLRAAAMIGRRAGEV